MTVRTARHPIPVVTLDRRGVGSAAPMADEYPEVPTPSGPTRTRARTKRAANPTTID